MWTDSMLQNKAQWLALDKYMKFGVLKENEYWLGNSANMRHGLWLNSRLQ